jgi:hypothetical protein
VLIQDIGVDIVKGGEGSTTARRVYHLTHTVLIGLSCHCHYYFLGRGVTLKQQDQAYSCGLLPSMRDQSSFSILCIFGLHLAVG